MLNIMKDITKFGEYLTEGILFKKFNNLSKEKKIDTIKEEVEKELLDVKEHLKKDISLLDKSYTQSIINKLNKEVSENVVNKLNLAIFFRTLRRTIKNTEPEHINDYIDTYFKEYFDTIYDRLKIITEEEKEKVDKELDALKSPNEIEEDQSYINRKVYLKEKYLLQIELLKLQEWVKDNKAKILIICEGRDSAGKGSTIKRFVEHLNPKHYRVETFGVPTEYQKEHWFDRYNEVLPNEGEIVFFDRSYYNRAVVEPAMGYCTEEQYHKFMIDVNPYEEDLINNKHIILIKFWFSITREKQLQRFELRKISPIKYWKYSPNDEASLNKWDILTKFKEQMFNETSTDLAPWLVVDSNDKRSAQLNAIRVLLNKVPYSKNKNERLLKTYKEVVYEI
jgi:polyphosphate kinase 2